jgi:hypothetical protein
MNRISIVAILAFAAACASSGTSTPNLPLPPSPDPRVGLKAGLMNAQEATYGFKVEAKVPSPPGFLGVTNSDLAFVGKYAIQGNYAGLQIWDMSNPAKPTIAATYPCPASQNDVSAYRNLLFMSSEGNGSRADCAAGGIRDTVSKDRVRGVRIFDISDITKPRLVTAVQTCRGSHTHTLVEDPRDRENVYIYISGSAGIRSPNELAGCTRARPDSNENTSLWRIEIIKVPLANPEAAAIVNRANIFTGLKAPHAHGEAEADIANAKKAADAARAAGGFVATIPSGSGTMEIVLGPGFTRPMLDSIVRMRGGSGAPNAADSTQLRNGVQGLIDRMFGANAANAPVPGVSPISVNRQCHDITVYPALQRAGGACEGHGFLLDISDPVNPRRMDAVSDSNFAYWHSATFNNDGTKILFSDEWGGGGGPKCRASDKKEWGSDAIFEIVNGKMEFRSYYKLSAAQTENENCVAHNGSLVPIPGRDVMVQSWYQGGVSMFDWTDARNPKEIAYFDRGPVDSTRMGNGGTWSVYWYNGTIVSSEIGRGLDAMSLVPSAFVTQNEIDAANTVKLTYFNAQGQPKFNWPPSYPLARAYVDQLERNKCLSRSRIAAVRKGLSDAEAAGTGGKDALKVLATSLDGDMNGSCDKPKLQKLKSAIQDLSTPIVP